MYRWFKNKYKNLNRGNTKPFISTNQIKYCKVVDIINGHTIIIIMDINKNTYKWHVRLDKYWSYTISDIDRTNDINIKNEICKKAHQSKLYLQKIIDMESNKIFKIHINGFAHDGLLLGELYFCNNPTLSINQIMIDNKYGTKCKLLSTNLHN